MFIGFLVNDLGNSQLNYYLTKNANKYLAKNPTSSVTLFYENLTPHAFPAHFSMTHISDAYGFAGPLVATSLLTAERLLAFPKPSASIFYVWDLEWTRMGGFDYRALQGIYCNRRLTLWARSREHSNIICDCWNRPATGVVDDFNFDDIEREISFL